MILRILNQRTNHTSAVCKLQSFFFAFSTNVPTIQVPSINYNRSSLHSEPMYQPYKCVCKLHSLFFAFWTNIPTIQVPSVNYNRYLSYTWTTYLSISVGFARARPNYIYSIACEVWLWVLVNHHTNIITKTHNQNPQLTVYKKAKQWSSGFGRFWQCQKCNILVITQVLVLCLICTHSPSGAPWASCVFIRQSTLACVTTYTCNTLRGRKLDQPFQYYWVMEGGKQKSRQSTSGFKYSLQVKLFVF